MGAAIADYDGSLVNRACANSAPSVDVPPPFCGLTDFTMRCGDEDWDKANEQCGLLCKPGIIDCDDQGLVCQGGLDLTACASSRCGTGWNDADAYCRPVCKNDDQCSEGLTCQGNLDCVGCEAYTGQTCVDDDPDDYG